MKRFTKLLLSALICLTFSAPALAYDFEANGIFYKITSNNTVAVTYNSSASYSGYVKYRF